MEPGLSGASKLEAEKAAAVRVAGALPCPKLHFAIDRQRDGQGAANIPVMEYVEKLRSADASAKIPDIMRRLERVEAALFRLERGADVQG